VPGSAKPRGPVPRSPSERILARLVLDPVSGCHVWPGAVSMKGYPQIQTGSMLDGTRRPRRCHRVLFDPPRGLVVHHWCENKLCLNPEHIEFVTPGQHSLIHDTAANARAGQ
jgi:HNH endonuclease